MLPWRSRNLAGEEGVLISLVISLGMIILSVIGLWLWKVLTPIAPALSCFAPIEVP